MDALYVPKVMQTRSISAVAHYQQSITTVLNDLIERVLTQLKKDVTDLNDEA
jgi:hypothetical protein